MRVLVVDDEPINRMIIREMLSSVQIEVLEASGAADGLELLNRDAFDMVFMDIRMPGMDGFEATRRIREMTDQRAAVPIVVVTGDVTDDCKKQAQAAGADCVLHKPVSMKELLGAVANTISAVCQPLPA